MKKFQLSLSRRNRSGFTLVEVAIVLAIAGTIIAGIFSVSKFISGENSEIKDALRQVFLVASNIQSQYNAVATGSTPTADWGAAGSNITSHMNSLQLIPGEMTNNGTCCQDALGGSFLVIAGPNAQGDEFVLKLQSLSPAACTSILLNLPLSDPGFGYNSVYVGSNGSTGIKETIVQSGNGISVQPPLSQMLTNATSWCAQPSKTNEIDIGYKIHP